MRSMPLGPSSAGPGRAAAAAASATVAVACAAPRRAATSARRLISASGTRSAACLAAHGPLLRSMPAPHHHCRATQVSQWEGEVMLQAGGQQLTNLQAAPRQSAGAQPTQLLSPLHDDPRPEPPAQRSQVLLCLCEVLGARDGHCALRMWDRGHIKGRRQGGHKRTCGGGNCGC